MCYEQEELEAREKRQARFARFGAPEPQFQPAAAAAVNEAEVPPSAPLESYTQLRPNALHLQCASIQHLDTAAVLRWSLALLSLSLRTNPKADSALLFRATTYVRKDQLKGMEWIDDTTACLVFTDPHAAVSAIQVLLLDPSILPALGAALSRLEDIYTEPAPEDLQAVAAPRAAWAIEGSTPAWIRFALFDDKKAQRARETSRYYAQHAPQPPQPSSSSANHGRSAMQDLDAELDAFTAGSEFDQASTRRNRRTRTRRGSGTRDRDAELDRLDRSELRHQTASSRGQGLAALDAELDAYLGSGDPSSSGGNADGGRQQQNSGTELFPSLAGFRSNALNQAPAAGSLANRLGPQQPQSQTAPVSTSGDLFPNRPKATDLFDAKAPKASGLRGWDD